MLLFVKHVHAYVCVYTCWEHVPCPLYTTIYIKCSFTQRKQFYKKKIWVKGRIRIAGFFVFSHIRMMGYFRLDLLRVNKCPAGLENWPRGVRRNCENTKKLATTDSSLDPFILYIYTSVWVAILLYCYKNWCFFIEIFIV